VAVAHRGIPAECFFSPPTSDLFSVIGVVGVEEVIILSPGSFFLFFRPFSKRRPQVSLATGPHPFGFLPRAIIVSLAFWADPQRSDFASFPFPQDYIFPGGLLFPTSLSVSLLSPSRFCPEEKRPDIFPQGSPETQPPTPPPPPFGSPRQARVDDDLYSRDAEESSLYFCWLNGDRASIPGFSETARACRETALPPPLSSSSCRRTPILIRLLAPWARSGFFMPLWP